MCFERDYEKAVQNMHSEPSSAIKLFLTIISKIAAKGNMCLLELKIYALSNMHLYNLGRNQNITYAKESILACEKYSIVVHDDVQIYSCYLLLLELTYQYQKAFEVLLTMLSNDSLQVLALKHLSSPVYEIEGLQRHDDCIKYKKKLIDMTLDTKVKQKLIRELQYLRTGTDGDGTDGDVHFPSHFTK